jgi:hypothetical protein
MKFSAKILTFLCLLALVASCTKEVIVPAGQDGAYSKKGGEDGISVSVDGEGDDEHGDDWDTKEDDNNENDITDPDNDLDFD